MIVHIMMDSKIEMKQVFLSLSIPKINQHATNRIVTTIVGNVCGKQQKQHQLYNQ